MSDPTEQVELLGEKSLSDKDVAVRRRWAADGAVPAGGHWMSDEGVQYVFAKRDIAILLEGYDALAAELADTEMQLARASMIIMRHEDE